MKEKNKSIFTKDYFLLFFSILLLNFGVTFPIGLMILIWLIIQKLQKLYIDNEKKLSTNFYN